MYLRCINILISSPLSCTNVPEKLNRTLANLLNTEAMSIHRILHTFQCGASDSSSYSDLDEFDEEITDVFVTAGYFDYGKGRQHLKLFVCSCYGEEQQPVYFKDRTFKSNFF
ncbi:Uncharacterised protein [uncultured archaeon]|nr:Uncharacterised protein [uncultured archaeon]